MQRPTSLLAMVMSFMLLAFFAVVPAPCTWASPQDNSLIVGASQEPKTMAGDFLDVISNQAIKSEIQNYLYPHIISTNLDGDRYAVMATELPTVDNQRLRFTELGQGKRRLEMTITLRPDLRWSDGQPITTDDIAFYYEVGTAKGMSVLNPDYWARVKLHPVKDPYNFTVSFEPAYYTDLLSDPISYRPAHIMRAEWAKTKDAAAPLDANKDAEKLNELYRDFFQKFSTPDAVNQGKMVSAGPFVIKRWVPGSSLELVRTNTFFLTPADEAGKYLQRVVYRFFQNTNALLVAILSGNVDVTSGVGLTFDQARSPQLVNRAPGRFDIWFVPGAIFEHIAVNQFTNVQQVHDLQLQDPRTRQALLYAMNREGMTKAFFDNLQPVAHTWIAPVHPLFNGQVQGYAYSVEQAQKLLAELGWTMGPDGILQRTVDGRTVKFELEFVTTAGDALRERTQEFLANNLKQVGITIKINNAPSAAVFAYDYIGRAVEGKWAGLFEFADVSGLAEDGTLFACQDLNTGAPLVPTKDNHYQGHNVGGWCNSQFDTLRAAAVSEFDATKRKALFDQMQALWAAYLPALPLYFRSSPYVVPKGLVNYVSAAYAGGFGTPSWEAWNIGWASKGARQIYDQERYALSLKKLSMKK
jgi:peptide/nickel transport system substrate-binding protein